MQNQDNSQSFSNGQNNNNNSQSNNLFTQYQLLSKRVFEDGEQFGEEGLKLLETILLSNTPTNTIRIRNYTPEESSLISMLLLKQNVLVSVKIAIETQEQLSNTFLDAVIEILFTSNTIATNNPNFLLEKTRIERELFYLIIDICYMTKYTNSKLSNYIREKSMPDELSVNMCLLVSDTNDNFKSYELQILSTLKIDPVLVNFLESYKDKLRKIVKETIIDEIVKKVITSNNNHLIKNVYSIFFILNDRKSDIFYEIEEIHCDEYIGFISSTITDSESAEYAVGKLGHYFDKLEDALKSIIGYYSSSNTPLKLSNSDETLLIYILTAISKVVPFNSNMFNKYITLFTTVLQYNMYSTIKALIYDILTNYLTDKDIYIKKVLDENITTDHKLLYSAISFINAYNRRVEYEEMLVRTNKSVGSAYLLENINDDLTNKYKVLALKSENIDCIMECFSHKLDDSIITVNYSHIRNTLTKHPNLTDKILMYQIKNKTVIDDILLINLLVSNSSEYFFSWVNMCCSIKKDTTKSNNSNNINKFLNINFLDRISDNIHEGIALLTEQYTKSVGGFIINNCNYFNGLVENYTYIQPKIVKLYEKVVEDFIGEVEFKAKKEEDSLNSKDSIVKTEVDTLILDPSDEFVSDGFFGIFSKQLVYNYYTKNKTDSILRQYNKQPYSNYVIAKIVCNMDVAEDIAYMQQNVLNVDEILGITRLVGNNNLTNNVDVKVNNTNNILSNFGVKDSQYFTKHFVDASSFEKFLLFFSIDAMTPVVENMIKSEIFNCNKKNNSMFLDMCMVQLMNSNNSNLDGIVRALESKLYKNNSTKNNSSKTLLSQLALKNLSGSGRYFSKQLLDNLPRNQVEKALFFIYFSDIRVWDREYVYNIAQKMDYANNRELEYIVDDYKRYG